MKFQHWSDNSVQFETCSPEETKSLGEMAGSCAYPGLCLLLFGGLGMGKTQFTQGVGTELGIKNVKSPTFILIAEHEGRLPLIHADLYRLAEQDVEPLALEDYMSDGCLLVVEWAERWASRPDCDCWNICFSADGSDDWVRTVRLSALGEKASGALDRLCDLYGEKNDSTWN